jgi:hypothetical protein
MMSALLLTGLAFAEEGELTHPAVPDPLPVLRMDAADVPGGDPPDWTFTLPSSGNLGALSATMDGSATAELTYTVSEPDPAAPGSNRVVRTVELFDAATTGVNLEMVAGSAPVVRFRVRATARRTCQTTWPAGTTACVAWNYITNTDELP